MNVWESMGSLAAARSLKGRMFLQVTQESVSVLKIMRKSMSGTTSNMWYDIEGSYDKTLPLALLLVVHTRNNTDDNKLVIFSGIALYYGDTYYSKL